MDDDGWNLELIFWVSIGILIAMIGLISIPTIDYGDTEALVKVQEVGVHYAWLSFGEQNYIRVQNAYSDQYSASSESWETCIDSRDIEQIKEAKNNRTVLNIRVKGNGISTIFTCLSGDRVIEVQQHK